MRVWSDVPLLNLGVDQKKPHSTSMNWLYFGIRRMQNKSSLKCEHWLLSYSRPVLWADAGVKKQKTLRLCWTDSLPETDGGLSHLKAMVLSLQSTFGQSAQQLLAWLWFQLHTEPTCWSHFWEVIVMVLKLQGFTALHIRNRGFLFNSNWQNTFAHAKNLARKWGRYRQSPQQKLWSHVSQD